MSEQTFTVREIAEYFRVSRTAVHNWMKSGELGFEEISPVSRRKIIPLSALKKFAKKRRLDITGLINPESK